MAEPESTDAAAASSASGQAAKGDETSVDAEEGGGSARAGEDIGGLPGQPGLHLPSPIQWTRRYFGMKFGGGVPEAQVKVRGDLPGQEDGVRST